MSLARKLSRLLSYRYMYSYGLMKSFERFPKLYQHPKVRHYYTKGYTSGRIAIGETFNRLSAIGPRTGERINR